MEIVILGTSAVKPLPRENCHCPICCSKNKKDRRMRSSILINRKFLIDCGPDILNQIKNQKLKIKNLRAIFITHRHFDHIVGLKKIASPRLVGLGPNNLVLYISKIDAKILDKKILSKFKVKIIKPFQKIKVDNLVFQPIPVIHPGSKNTFAFKIWENKKTLVYMPDYKKIPKKSLGLFQNIDVLIVGGASLSKKLPWHAAIIETIKLTKQLGVKKIYFTHIGHRTLPHQELVKFVQKTGGKNFNICFDGQRTRV